MTAGRFNIYEVNSAPYHAAFILSQIKSPNGVLIDGDTGVIFIREPLVEYLALARRYFVFQKKKPTPPSFADWLESYIEDPLIKEAMLFTHRSLERTSKKAATRYGL